MSFVIVLLTFYSRISVFVFTGGLILSIVVAVVYFKWIYKGGIKSKLLGIILVLAVFIATGLRVDIYSLRFLDSNKTGIAATTFPMWFPPAESPFAATAPYFIVPDALLQE